MVGRLAVSAGCASLWFALTQGPGVSLANLTWYRVVPIYHLNPVFKSR